MPELFSLKGRVALVTGASRGLGRNMARTLAAQGALVVVNARKAADLQSTADEIRKTGGQAGISAFDVTDEPAVVKAINYIVEEHGRLDILVNNAGIMHRQLIVETKTEDWKRIIDTNLNASFVMAREAAKVMLKQKYGRIINLSSVMAILGRATVAAYVASKHGIVGLTKTLAAEVGPHVTVNSIAPGYIRTEINTVLQHNAEFTAMLQQRTAAARWGEAKDLDGMLVLLASEASSYITGQTMVVDGGLTSILA
jgi:gluconate 5-dehydrogenase